MSSSTLPQMSAIINASRKSPAPKCGMMIGTMGNAAATACRSSGIAVADFEGARQAQLAAHADGEHAAVHEQDGSRPRRCDLEEAAHPIILEGEAMHRGKKTHAAQPPCIERRGGLRGRVRLRGIDHEESDQPPRMPCHRFRHRTGIARDAGDQRCPRDARPIELAHPSIGKGLGGTGRVPTELGQRR